MVSEQLKYSGMLETVRIRALGYTYRYAFDDLKSHFFALCVTAPDVYLTPRETAQALVTTTALLPTDYQFGETKVGRLHWILLISFCCVAAVIVVWLLLLLCGGCSTVFIFFSLFCFLE